MTRRVRRRAQRLRRARDGRVVPHGEPRHERLEGRLDADALRPRPRPASPPRSIAAPCSSRSSTSSGERSQNDAPIEYRLDSVRDSRNASSTATAADDTVAPVAALTELIAFLDELLEPERFDDYGPNGLQVPGREEVGRRRDRRLGRPRAVRARDRRRRRPRPHAPRPLLEEPAARDRPRRARRGCSSCSSTTSSLAAYHLPLDAHLEHGNNALLAGALGAELIAPFPAHERDADRRRRAPARRRADAAPSSSRASRAAVGGREPLAFLAGPERDPHRRHRQRRRLAVPARRDRRGPRRVRHRRADRVGDAARAGARHPLPRRRPLRDGDPRRPPSRRPARRANSASSTCSSTCRTRSERPSGAPDRPLSLKRRLKPRSERPKSLADRPVSGVRFTQRQHSHRTGGTLRWQIT